MIHIFPILSKFKLNDQEVYINFKFYIQIKSFFILFEFKSNLLSLVFIKYLKRCQSGVLISSKNIQVPEIQTIHTETNQSPETLIKQDKTSTISWLKSDKIHNYLLIWLKNIQNAEVLKEVEIWDISEEVICNKLLKMLLSNSMLEKSVNL